MVTHVGETETQNPLNLGPVKIWSDSKVRKTSGCGPSLPFLRHCIVPILWDSKFSLEHALVWTFFSLLIMATISEATVFGGERRGLLPPWMNLCVTKILRGLVSSFPSSEDVLHPLDVHHGRTSARPSVSLSPWPEAQLPELSEIIDVSLGICYLCTYCPYWGPPYLSYHSLKEKSDIEVAPEQKACFILHAFVPLCSASLP